MIDDNIVFVRLTGWEEERVIAILVKRHAHFSVVRFTRGGIDYELEVANDDYEFRGEEDVDDTTD